MSASADAVGASRDSQLSADGISLALSPSARARVARLEVVPEIDSTNSELLRRRALAPGSASVLLAERQTAGRGRRGRAWLAAPGEVLCLSMGWTIDSPRPDLSALSLAIGVCAARALGGLGLSGLALKWPNDLVANEGKLGGILIETRTEPGDVVYAVIGIGVNLALGDLMRQEIKASGTEPVDVRTLSGNAPLAPSVVAAGLIDSMTEGLAEFSRSGFASFVAEWNTQDCLRTRPVLVRHTHGEARGVARGIDATGALLVETARGLERFLSGEVSVRSV